MNRGPKIRPVAPGHKFCTKCDEPKPLEEFGKNKHHPDGHHWWCYSCMAAYRKAHYAAHADEYRARAKRYAADNPERRKVLLRRWNAANPGKQKLYAAPLREARQEMVYQYLLAHPCVDCGERDPLVLDFDHVKGQKIAGISKLVCDIAKMPVLLAEMKKCEIRCANCHRRKTLRERNTWRYKRAGVEVPVEVAS